MVQKVRCVPLGDLIQHLHQGWAKDPKHQQLLNRENRLLSQLIKDTRIGKIGWALKEEAFCDEEDLRRALVISKITGECNFRGVYQNGSRVNLYYCCCGSHVYAEVAYRKKGKKQETFLPNWVTHKEFWRLLDTVRNRLRQELF